MHAARYALVRACCAPIRTSVFADGAGARADELADAVRHYADGEAAGQESGRPAGQRGPLQPPGQPGRARQQQAGLPRVRRPAGSARPPDPGGRPARRPRRRRATVAAAGSASTHQRSAANGRISSAQPIGDSQRQPAQAVAAAGVTDGAQEEDDAEHGYRQPARAPGRPADLGRDRGHARRRPGRSRPRRARTPAPRPAAGRSAASTATVSTSTTALATDATVSATASDACLPTDVDPMSSSRPVSSSARVCRIDQEDAHQAGRERGVGEVAPRRDGAERGAVELAVQERQRLVVPDAADQRAPCAAGVL